MDPARKQQGVREKQGWAVKLKQAELEEEGCPDAMHSRGLFGQPPERHQTKKTEPLEIAPLQLPVAIPSLGQQKFEEENGKHEEVVRRQ